MNLNKAQVIGNLTQDPEVRHTQSGQMVCNFTVATNRIWKDQQGQKQQQAEFHNIVAWGKLAEVVSNYLKKGSLAYVEGRLQTRSWEGKDGGKKYTTEIIASSLQLGPRTGGVPASTPASTPVQENNKEDIPVIQEGEEEIDLSDIPL